MKVQTVLCVLIAFAICQPSSCTYSGNEADNNKNWSGRSENLQKAKGILSKCSGKYICEQDPSISNWRQGSKCIELNQFCDNKKDCRLGDDEYNCSILSKCSGKYVCKPDPSISNWRQGSKCIELNQICDNKNDCRLGDDELNCVASSLPCNRPCDGKPMVCEYNFTVENYFVLSKACHSCPFVQSDCFRPHCVSTNGVQRPVTTINRQLPGPPIEVCQGDIVRVWVENKMEDGSSTTIHWHGLQQRNSCYMDGVPGLTQCNIPPRETFRYEFFAHNAGTHWYHSHTGVQFGDGALGAFIVREKENKDPNHALYDVDSSDHVMTLHDWEDKPVMNRYLEEMHDIWKWPVPLKALVNGRGQSLPVEDSYNITGYTEAPLPTLTPFHMLNVSHNTRYRFRLVGAMTRCSFRVMIDGHQMTVISADGEPLKPETVGSFMIYAGERYDFVVDANAEPGNYWIKFQGRGDCAPRGAHGYAILHYDDVNATTPSGNITDFTQTDAILNPEPTTDLPNVKILQEDMRSGRHIDENFDTEIVDVTHYISLKYLDNDNSIYSHPEYYPATSRKGILTPTLNNITMWLPPSPLLTQWNDVTDKRLCNKDILNTATECNDDLCHCLHMLSVDLGQTVELFLVSHTTDPHPMHLHGHTFRVVGSGELMNKDDLIDDVIQQDKNGQYPRILTNPMYRDTVSVYGNGGYTILRFKADNPGVWFFHCHVEGHLMQGMALVIKVGDVTDFPEAPGYFPKCGGYTYGPKTYCKT